ncbi:hypothetical protein CXZ10_07440 [Pleomorphomonas diazotrophica]|uniref:Uncharacterized protein n=2 Tax=Pleomorphomonas diazotrophica TaxID=1166257 RepID=A0A1I4UXH1_9HYPH|nr:hypothetical protein CXZ10_07440 [Pleomorphomonas diazotrophica]SFM93727.1 hypothetical protein SAMN05192571_109159 [Pleomorphomonas diazotrophica]
MTIGRYVALGLLLCSATGMNPALAQDEYVAAARAYVEQNVVPFLSEAVVVDAINAQNAKFAGLQQADIDALDQKWRAEVEAADKPMIDETLSSPLSKFLIERREASEGVITELFVTDGKGLNVGQSDPTSDYWQGDEAKWQKSFQAGPGAIFVDEVEKDESTQQLQTQVSATIVDPKTGAAIGAVTVGLNVDGL